MKAFLTSFFLFFLLRQSPISAQTLPVQDSDFGCVSEADAQRYVQDFRIDIKSFGGRDLCDLKVDSKKLFNDLQLIEKGQFVSEKPHPFIRGFVAADNYYSWLKQQTRGVERKNDIPYATAYNIGGFFTMQDGWSQLSTLGRVGAFIHEARHTAGYKHVNCDKGAYQGTRVLACDRNYNDGGSFAVEMEYYARVSVQGANFHPVYKKMARLMAMARSNIFFNTVPMQSREGLLGLTVDQKKSFLFDGLKWIPREIPDMVGRLKRTSYGAVLFDGLKALSIELYQNSGFTDAVTDNYSYYKLLVENKKSTKDFEEFDFGLKRYVVHLSKDNILTAYDFSRGTWGVDQQIPFDVVKTSTALPGQAQSGFYLISGAGEVYAYQPESQRLIGQPKTWDFNDKNVVGFNGQTLILKNDGKIYVQNSQNLKIWDNGKIQFSDLVAVPLYDAFEVVKE